MVDNNMKSFFNTLKAKNSKPKLPKYLEKAKGRFMVIYTNQAISKKDLKNGFIVLSKTNVRIKTKVSGVKQVRVVPCNNHIVVEVLYEAKCKGHISTDKKYCGIDLGLNNLMTCVFQDDTPVIFNGRPLKSVNWNYNKRKAYLQSKLPKGRKTSKMIGNISLRRNNRVSDYLHKITSMFINYAVSKGITETHS
jgi:putative transposase